MSTALRILADECLGPITVEWLKTYSRFKVVTVDELGLSGAKDTEIIRVAQQQNIILITVDGDFADSKRFPPGTHPGVIWVKVQPPSQPRIREALKRFFLSGKREMCRRNIVVLREKNFDLISPDDQSTFSLRR